MDLALLFETLSTKYKRKSRCDFNEQPEIYFYPF